MNYAAIALQEYDMAAPWLKSALEAYADGVNAYITDKKPGLDPKLAELDLAMIPGGLASVVMEGMEPVQLSPTDMQLSPTDMQLSPTDMQLSALSLKWTALEPRTTLQSMLMVNEAQSFDEFREALRS